jgi:RimJ/RimL family protein N-acetyltransferase
MIKLRKARQPELEIFHQMEQQSHVGNFLDPHSVELHHSRFADPDTTYLSIESENGALAGYIVLVEHPASNSLEFARILIDQSFKGIGQQAMQLMEEYGVREFAVNRIWLDVYEDNTRGMHVYEKLGYQRFNQKTIDGRILYFYEKNFE